MRILIIVSQPHIRAALHFLLSQEADCELVGAVGGGPGLASKLAVTAPDILVLDWGLPRGAARRLLVGSRRLPRPPHIIVLGSRTETEWAVLAAGADAFVPIDDAPDTILIAIRSFKTHDVRVLDEGSRPPEGGTDVAPRDSHTETL